MRDNERMEIEQMNDTTIAQLLTHLQQLRRTVPVNYKLKAELKEKLLQRMKELDASRSTVTPKRGLSRKKVWAITSLMVLVVAVAFFSFYSKDSIHLDKPAFVSIPIKASLETVDLNAQGTRVAFIDTDAKLYTRSTANEKENQVFNLPKTEGAYLALAWSGDDNQIAVAEVQNNTTRLWVIDLPAKGRSSSSRLLREETGALYKNPSWSPDNAEIAYSRIVNGKEEIWVNSTVSFQERKIAEGSEPSWSPSGNKLAFVNDGTVTMLNLATGERATFGHGSWPSWESNDRLTYITPQNNLVAIRVDEPQYEERPLALPKHPDEKVVRANWVNNGKHLLIAYQTEKMYVFSIASRN